MGLLFSLSNSFSFISITRWQPNNRNWEHVGGENRKEKKKRKKPGKKTHHRQYFKKNDAELHSIFLMCNCRITIYILLL